MKKYVGLLLLFVMMFLPFNVFATTRTAKDLTFEIEYVDWYIFTRDKIYDDDLEGLNLNKEDVLAYMEENDIYLDALLIDYNADPSVELTVVAKPLEYEIYDMSELSDDEITELGEELKKELGVDSYTVETVNDNILIHMSYYNPNNNQYMINYFTIFDSYIYTITVRNPVEYSETDMKIINKSINTITFNDSSSESSDYLYLIVVLVIFILCLLILLCIYFVKKKKSSKAQTVFRTIGIILIIGQFITLPRIDTDYLLSSNNDGVSNSVFIIGKIAYVFGFLLIGIVGVILLLITKTSRNNNSKKRSKKEPVDEETKVTEEIKVDEEMIEEIEEETENNNTNALSVDEFSAILAFTVLVSGDSFSKLCESIEVEGNYENHFYYLNYLLYITQQFLEKDYSNKTVKSIIDSTIDTIVESVNFIKEGSVENVKKMVKKHYKALEDKNNNIFVDGGLDNLIKSFESDLGLNPDIITEHHIMADFTSFITHHIKDITNKKIENQ